MSEKITLEYPREKIEDNCRLQEPLARFEYAERVPVTFGVSARYVLHARGVGFLEYFSDPRTQVRHQLLNYQWRLENVPGDWVTGAGVSVSPDFQQGAQAGSFEVEVRWFDHSPPKVVHPLRRPEDVEALDLPDVRSGMFGRILDWYEAMVEAAEDFEVTFNGEPVPINVSFGFPGGPFPKALALAQTNLLHWVYECPEALHRLMDLTTESHLACERYRRERLGLSKEGLGIGCDGGEMLSPATFREFISPYQQRAYGAFPGSRGLHMCGRIDHLMEILADEWQITNLNGFGACADKRKLASTMGGRVMMNGGVDCLTLLNGTPSQVREAALEALEILAPCGGYTLCDGYNLAPGTPLENLQAMVDAAIEYGKPEVKRNC